MIVQVSHQIQEIFAVYAKEIEKCGGSEKIGSESQSKLAEHKAIIYADVIMPVNQHQVVSYAVIDSDC